MGRKVTAQDVARAAGVSISTVDRVLNNRGGVDHAKEVAVLAAARRLRLDRALDLRAARTLRVAVFIQSPDNPFHAALKQAVDAQNGGSDPWNIQLRVFHVAPDLTPAQIACIDTVGTDHDALIVCVPHDDALARVLSRLMAVGRPVVALATDLRCPGIHYIGPDNRQAGRLAGDLMGRLIGPAGGEIVAIAGHLSMIGHAERLAGFQQVLAERHPSCVIVRQSESFDLADRAADIAWQALRDRPGIRGIYNIAVGALLVAQAVARHGRDLVLITHELTPDRRELLRAATLDAVIDQDPALEIQTAVHLIAHLHGRSATPPPEGPTPLRVFLRENC